MNSVFVILKMYVGILLHFDDSIRKDFDLSIKEMPIEQIVSFNQYPANLYEANFLIFFLKASKVKDNPLQHDEICCINY